MKLLREMRARLVEAIDEVHCVRDLEPLYRRLEVVCADIEELSAIREPSRSPGVERGAQIAVDERNRPPRCVGMGGFRAT